MALTPEDVVKKEFSKPKGFGRSGYDENQVDDFLDEIVVELRRLTAQNDDLSEKLEDCRRGGQGGAATTTAAVPALTPVTQNAQPSADVAAKDEEIARLKKELAEASKAPAQVDTSRVEALAAERDAAKKELADAKARIDELEKAKAEKAAAPVATADREAAAAAEAANVIALAQRVHDEHVLKGQTERDRLIAEATAHHDKVISEANAESEKLVTTAQAKHDELIASGTVQATKLVDDAQEKRRSVLAGLESERESLDAEIEKLKKFEADYRANLKGYLNEQLRFLDGKTVEPAKPAGRTTK